MWTICDLCISGHRMRVFIGYAYYVKKKKFKSNLRVALGGGRGHSARKRGARHLASKICFKKNVIVFNRTALDLKQNLLISVFMTLFV